MKTYVRRWLPAIVQNRTNAALLGIAAAAIIGGAVASPSTNASMLADNISSASAGANPASGKPADQAAAAKAAAAKAAADKAAAAKAAAAKAAAARAALPAHRSLKADVALQPNYYYCGPAATRIALAAHGKTPSFDALAQKLGTTTEGTGSAYDITRVLNAELGANRYHTTEISGQSATRKQIDQLQADILTTINHGDTIVANIAGTLKDTAGDVHSYEGGHYLDVIGYADQGKTAVIGDPADAVGSPTYKLSTTDLANWIATRGYSSS